MEFKVKNRKIKISDNVIQIIQCYLQDSYEKKEAGGVLIACENATNDNLIIQFATEPMPKDKRTKTRFSRKDMGHVDFFKKIYNENKGVYTYIGEWHTHPESCPEYSGIDLKNWNKIRKQSGVCDKQYHIIAGFRYLRIWEYSKMHKEPSLVKTLVWSEIIE